MSPMLIVTISVAAALVAYFLRRRVVAIQRCRRSSRLQSGGYADGSGGGGVGFVDYQRESLTEGFEGGGGSFGGGGASGSWGGDGGGGGGDGDGGGGD